MRLIGVELYSEDLERSREFYQHVLGLEVTEDKCDHHVMFNGDQAFLCVETREAEGYPSRDKAVVFFEVASQAALVDRIGRDRFVKIESSWADLHDPDGHNVLLVQQATAP